MLLPARSTRTPPAELVPLPPATRAAPRQVRMRGDGLGLPALEQGRLLTGLADEGRIVRDSYSNGGTGTQLEEACATLLGKERAVFMPTGTLANHLAVRALAGGEGRRAEGGGRVPEGQR